MLLSGQKPIYAHWGQAPLPADDKLYQKYFTINETPVRGKTFSYKEDAIRKAEKNFGYFALMSNGIKDPVEPIHIYRLKDLIEKSFGNLKERLSMRCMSVASEENFEGKLFVQFVALQMVSYIKKQRKLYEFMGVNVPA